MANCKQRLRPAQSSQQPCRHPPLHDAHKKRRIPRRLASLKPSYRSLLRQIGVLNNAAQLGVGQDAGVFAARQAKADDSGRGIGDNQTIGAEVDVVGVMVQAFQIGFVVGFAVFVGRVAAGSPCPPRPATGRARFCRLAGGRRG